MVEKINLVLLERFTSLRDRYAKLIGQLNRAEITFDHLLADINMDNIHLFRNECAEDYAEKLLREKDYPAVYRQDIITAIQEKDLDALEILLTAPQYVAWLRNDESDINMLWFFVRCFNEGDEGKVGLAKILFEQVLDTSEWDLPEYTDILDAILSVQWPPGWFDNFTAPLKKLIYRADGSERTYEVMRKGLSSNDAHVRQIIEECLPSPNDDEED
jgi:hypothetical protein